ncbi:hypothetical protein N7447_000999 [Penicillium robsamsonii]|uniref:uncharacterized protein n=1 Tax=Penicillium robsamsonii TaxID=1792511 RepID=UPI00254858D6|nr:uncharacterized protein N7447_000999 [Penicillium robsamsonii]KAJ5834973.1 hypothetical protein N7447_000999 [Penicillium robsamsonii]
MYFRSCHQIPGCHEFLESIIQRLGVLASGLVRRDGPVGDLGGRVLGLTNVADVSFKPRSRGPSAPGLRRVQYLSRDAGWIERRLAERSSAIGLQLELAPI